MRSSVQAVDYELDEASLEFIQRRLEFALSRFGPLVRTVAVQLTRKASGSGEVDYGARVAVKLARTSSLVEAEVHGSDVTAAFTFALDRARRTIERQATIRRA